MKLRYVLLALMMMLTETISAKQFVSLKSSKINMRVGPGEEFPISWIFIKSGLPMMFVAEFQQWKKVKFLDNTEGWIHQNMISGKNTAIVTSDNALLYRSSSESFPIARVEKNVIAKVLKNEKDWIKVDINKIKGWMKSSDLWGINDE